MKPTYDRNGSMEEFIDKYIKRRSVGGVWKGIKELVTCDGGIGSKYCNMDKKSVMLEVA